MNTKRLNGNTPIAFTDGSTVYEKLAKNYITHKKGFFILAPSGAGKTYFVNNQTDKHWVDGDKLWEATGAHPDVAWWTMDPDVINEVDQRSDIITVQAKKLGFWIMGASNFWLKPDAIVIPPWDTHKKYIKHREETAYDGGALTKDLKQVQSHRKVILKWAEQGVPKFKSIPEADDYFKSLINKIC